MRALYILSFCCLSLTANAFLLDDVMTKEEQVQTGVSRLTPGQKASLETWLNQNFTLKNPPVLATSMPSLSLNIENGQKLQLSDGSVWQVAPGDVSKAALWITPCKIEIRPGNDINYPYILVNSVSHETVHAKQVTPPSTGTPPSR